MDPKQVRLGIPTIEEMNQEIEQLKAKVAQLEKKPKKEGKKD